MQYFSKNFIDFFKSLSGNNSKVWFDQNRQNYELNVKKPFERFITDLIEEISKQDPSVKMTAREATFGINKDIRFSKIRVLTKRLCQQPFLQAAETRSSPVFM